MSAPITWFALPGEVCLDESDGRRIESMSATVRVLTETCDVRVRIEVDKDRDDWRALKSQVEDLVYRDLPWLLGKLNRSRRPTRPRGAGPGRPRSPPSGAPPRLPRRHACHAATPQTTQGETP